MVMSDCRIIPLLPRISCRMVNILLIASPYFAKTLPTCNECVFLVLGSFCIYSNEDSFEYIRSSLEKTLLSNLEQEDRLPFQGLPIVIMFIPEASIDEMDAIKLREEGQSLADRYINCTLIIKLKFIEYVIILSIS